MVLELYREEVRKGLIQIGRFFDRLGLTPNQLTLASLSLSFLSGISFYFELLLIGGCLAVLGALFDVFDGVVARIRGEMTRIGDFVDHTADRLADAFIFCGITFSRSVSLHTGAAALIGVLLTAYVGTQAEAIGLQRIYGGIFSRSDIIATIFLFSVFSTLYNRRILGMDVFEIGILILAIGCNFTALQRSFEVWKRINR